MKMNFKILFICTLVVSCNSVFAQYQSPSVTEIPNLTKEQIEAIPKEVFEEMSLEQLRAFTQEQERSIPSSALRRMSPEQLDALPTSHQLSNEIGDKAPYVVEVESFESDIDIKPFTIEVDNILSDILLLNEQSRTSSTDENSSPLCCQGNLCTRDELPNKCGDIFGTDLESFSESGFGELLGNLRGSLTPKDYIESVGIGKATNQYCTDCLGISTKDYNESNELLMSHLREEWTLEIVNKNYFLSNLMEVYGSDLTGILNDFIENPALITESYNDEESQNLVREFSEMVSEIEIDNNREDFTRTLLTCGGVDFDYMTNSCGLDSATYEGYLNVVPNITQERFNQYVRGTAYQTIKDACLVEDDDERFYKVLVALGPLLLDKSDEVKSYDELVSLEKDRDRSLRDVSNYSEMIRGVMRNSRGFKGFQLLGDDPRFLCGKVDNPDYDLNKLGEDLLSYSPRSSSSRNSLKPLLPAMIQMFNSTCSPKMIAGYNSFMCSSKEGESSAEALTRSPVPAHVLAHALEIPSLSAATKIKICEQGGRVSDFSNPHAEAHKILDLASENDTGAASMLANAANLERGMIQARRDSSISINPEVKSPPRRLGGNSSKVSSASRGSTLATGISESRIFSENSSAESKPTRSTVTSRASRSPASHSSSSASTANSKSNASSFENALDQIRNMSNKSASNNFKSNYRSAPVPAERVSEVMQNSQNSDLVDRFNQIASDMEERASNNVSAVDAVRNALTANDVNLPESAGLDPLERDRLQREIDDLREDMNRRAEGETKEQSENRKLADAERRIRELESRIGELTSSRRSGETQNTLGLSGGSGSGGTSVAAANFGGERSLGRVDGTTGNFEFLNSPTISGGFSAQVPTNLSRLIQNKDSEIGFAVNNDRLVIQSGETFYPAELDDIVIDNGQVTAIVYQSERISIDSLSSRSQQAVQEFVQKKRPELVVAEIAEVREMIGRIPASVQVPEKQEVNENTERLQTLNSLLENLEREAENL